MIARKNRLFAAALAVALAASAALAQAPAKAPGVGDRAPDFTLPTHDGRTLTLSRLQGQRGALLVFFATWCPPCMAEVPHVKKFVEETRGKNLLVYGVNVQQDLDVVTRFVKDREINYRILLDGDGKVSAAYGVYGIPHLTGIDGNGVIRFVGHGLPEGAEREKLIKALTEGTTEAPKP